LTDDAVKAVKEDMKKNNIAMSPSQFGTAVHKAIEDEIKNNPAKYPNFKAEVSAIKTNEADEANQAEPNPPVYRGQKGSVRVDVFVLENGDTACVYDIKSGIAGLSPRRMNEIANNARTAFGNVKYLIIIEIRPGAAQNKVAKWVKLFCRDTINSISPNRLFPISSKQTNAHPFPRLREKVSFASATGG
jgi:hypothetical protein